MQIRRGAEPSPIASICQGGHSTDCWNTNSKDRDKKRQFKHMLVLKQLRYSIMYGQQTLIQNPKNVKTYKSYITYINQTWNLSKNLHDQIFGRKNFTHWKPSIETIFASNKQRKCIVVSNLALFWLKLNTMCKFFNSYEGGYNQVCVNL